MGEEPQSRAELLGELERLSSRVVELHVLTQQIAWHVGIRRRGEAKLYKFPIGERAQAAFHEVGISTLDEVAKFSRSQVAALPGVGAKTMVRLDALMDEHVLEWSRD